MSNFNQMPIGKKILLISLTILGIVFLCSIGSLVEFVDSTEYVIVQPVTGNAYVVDRQGPFLQNYGTCYHYKLRDQFWFSSKADEGKDADESIKIRFSEGGHANISGSISYQMPLSDEDRLRLHRNYKSQAGVRHELVKQIMAKSIYMSGPLMTSKESAAEKRQDLLSYIEDQAMFGIYKTVQADIKVHDELANTDKVITITKIVTDKSGVPLRQGDSPAKSYNISLSNLTINEIKYDESVEAQIKTQQEATMMIQTSIANARKAEQDAITAEQKGKADAATAKWKQEVLKAEAVTKAQQSKEVAALDAQTAIFEAQKVKTAADAKAYENARLVQAGLSPWDKATIEKETKIGVAAELAKMTLPSTVFIGGGNAGSPQASILESILSAKLLNLGEDKTSKK